MTPLVIRRAWPLLSALALFGAGCATSYDVRVDSIAKPKANAAQSYKIKSKDPRRGEENLRYNEAKELVKTALSGKGLYEASNEESADMIVELDFGIDSPRSKIEQVSVPVYAQVGGGVRYDTINVVDAKGNPSTRTVAVYDPPRSELVGYDERMGQVTVYEKYLRLSARENKAASEGRPPSELWSVDVSAEDESKDLRRYLPVMASASIDYIGKDSKNQQVVKVREDSPGVDFVKRGMPETTKIAVSSTVGPKS